MDPICEKCQEKLLYTNEIKESTTGLFKCDQCKDYLMIYYGVWHCVNRECDFDLCNLCKEGLRPHCVKCKGELKFTTAIPEYSQDLFACDHCNQTFKIETGSHHCFNCKAQYDVCIECRSKMV